MLIRCKLVLIVMALSPVSALAYVDPGSGMLVWQGLIALIGAALMFVRNPRSALKRLVDWIKRK
jgi:hypothetical protein